MNTFRSIYETKNMTMKYTLLPATSFLLSLTSFAQRIHFSDSTNQWTCYTHSCPSDPGLTPGEFNDYYSGDTLIGGLTYRRLTGGASGPVFVREDTIAKKVYIRGVDNPGDNVLYDYTLTVGDSFYVDTSSPALTAYYVASKDSVQISTLWYKTWHFIFAHGSGIPGASYTVIEGIGCDAHPLYPLAMPGNPEVCVNLTCFHNNGTTPLVSPEVDGYFDNVSSCILTYTAIKNIAANKVTACIFPNPLDQTSKIAFSYNIASGSLAVSNDIGQTIINTTFQNKEEILIGDKISMPGIYFYRATDNGSGKVFSGKFVY